MAALIDVIASALADRAKVIQNRRTNMTSGICGVTSGVI